MKLLRFEYIVTAALLGAFALWFGFDLYTAKRFLNHPEYVHYYHSFRLWFLKQLVTGHFPQWNPYWGLGHSTEIEASFPVDIYSPLELLFGPQFPAFQLLQIVLLLFAAVLGFSWLGLPPLIGAAAAILFFLAPWVNYFFFYFIKTNAFIGLLLSFPVALQVWKQGGKSFWLLTFLTAFTLFGTKIDFWFFHFSYLGCFGLVLLALESSKELRHCGKKILRFYGALFLGIACHAWQIIPLLQILKEADRLGSPPGIASFTSEDFYFRLLYSLASSPFLKIAFICGLMYLATYQKKSKAFFFAVSAVLLFLGMRMWNQPPFHFLVHPFGLGGLLAILFSVLTLKQSKVEVFRSSLLWLVLSIYWCRPGPSDLNEITILDRANFSFPAISGFLVFFGVDLVRQGREVPKALYALILLLFLLRDQGQVILSHLLGLVWIPTRDNYLFDFSLALLAGLGLLEFEKIRWGVGRTFAVAASLLLVLGASNDFYYSHPLIEKTPKGFPFYFGDPEVTNVLRATKKSPFTRVYFEGSDVTKNLPMYGASLLEGVNQTHLFSSLISKRYHDWTVFHWFGFKPEEKWGAYEGEYSPETISKLPPRNAKGFSTDEVYWWALHAMPPPQLPALRLIGVEEIISTFPITTQPGLGLSRNFGSYFATAIKDPLPRAFGIDAISDSERQEYETSLQATPLGQEIQFGPYRRKVSPVEIESYSAERVVLKSNLDSDQEIILTDLFHPFWKAKLNGRETKISPAFSLFRSVHAPKGSHQIEFYCEIPFFRWALFISATAWLVLVLAISRSGLVSVFTSARGLPPKAVSHKNNPIPVINANGILIEPPKDLLA